MDIQFFTTRFSANAEAFERLLKDIEDEHARWKPAPDKWRGFYYYDSSSKNRFPIAALV